MGATLAARKGDDLSFRELLPSDRSPKVETAGEDDQELLTLDVVVEDHLVPGFEHVEACAEVLCAGTLGDPHGANPVRARLERIVEVAHVATLVRLRVQALSDTLPTLPPMAKQPTRIDLLELDIDLRLSDLWREAGEITDWNIDVVAAFMRAAYGKGYCDALTEDAPGSLCHDHGYRIPDRREAPSREA